MSESTETTKILKLDHIGIAVKSIEKALPFYQDILGLALKGREEVAGMKVKVAKLKTANVTLELIEPMIGEAAVSKFIEKRGEGIQHICFEAEDINATTNYLVAKGYQPVYAEPRIGAGGRKVNFLSPKDTFGILIELVER